MLWLWRQCAKRRRPFAEIAGSIRGIAQLQLGDTDRLGDPTKSRISTGKIGYAAVHLYGPGIDSGTYDYFTRAIVGDERSSRHDYKSSEDDFELVELVAADELALGYFGLGYYEENKARLKAVPIDDGQPANGTGPILPSSVTVGDGTYQPLSRPLFIYFAEDSLARGESTAFAEYYLANAADLAARTGYTPLTPELYATAKRRLAARKTGSAFDGLGSQVGMSIADLSSKEAD